MMKLDAENLKGCVCMLCRRSMAEHFNTETGEWTGCGAQTVFLPPMLLVLTPSLVQQAMDMQPAVETPPMPEPPPEPTPPTPPPVPRKRRTPAKAKLPVQEVVTPPQDTQAAAPAPAEETGRGRGRIAGRYLPGTGQPTRKTESIDAVYKMVKSHKRGMTVRDIAERLKMPTGTVGWAIQKLSMDGAVQYQPASA